MRMNKCHIIQCGFKMVELKWLRLRYPVSEMENFTGGMINASIQATAEKGLAKL